MAKNGSGTKTIRGILGINKFAHIIHKLQTGLFLGRNFTLKKQIFRKLQLLLCWNKSKQISCYTSKTIKKSVCQMISQQKLETAGHNFSSFFSKVVVTFYLKLRNEFQPFPRKKPVNQLRGLVPGRKWLKYISLSQIIHDYNFNIWGSK